LRSLKVIIVAGARPNFMKIASIIESIKEHNTQKRSLPIHSLLVHTGQHYGQAMSDVFFSDLEMPRPDVDLGVGSLSHAHQTAEIMKRFEEVLVRESPDCVVVVGDVNSTVACSLVASKIQYPDGSSRRSRPCIAHVEAGLRSFDRSMPEEINRIVTDTLSDFLFITEQSALKNLQKEGVSRNKIHWVGNTMVDTLLRHRQKSQKSEILSALGLTDSLLSPKKRLLKKKSRSTRSYALATLHRPSNVDNVESFREILDALAIVAQKIPVVFAVHPRTQDRIRRFQLGTSLHFDATPIPETGITCIAPLGYLDFLCLMSNAQLVLTDSGGIQEETTVLGIPCVTLRENTERPVTITSGTNILAGTKKEEIIRLALKRLRAPKQPSKPRYWDGKAGRRIIQILVRQLAKQAR
jgi:UDP-N-acetylglucosamine 2-epimerase (non-hydrolysing)